MTSSHADPPPSERQPEKISWYRSSLFNVLVIGAGGFLAPGMWNDMSSLGAESLFLVNAANALVFGLRMFYLGIFCLLGGPIANRIGLKYTLTLGTVGYPVYSAGLYANNRYGTVWLVLVGAVTCGISEVAQEANGNCIWLWFRTGGPLVGAAIVLGPNHSSDQKKRGKTLLLLLVFWAAYFNQYIGSNFANLFASQIMSMLLDYNKIPVKQRLNIGFYDVIFWHLVAWIYAWVNHPASQVSSGAKKVSPKPSHSASTLEIVICLPTTYIALREHVPVKIAKDYASEPEPEPEPGNEFMYGNEMGDDIQIKSGKNGKDVLKSAAGQTVEARM
ncbi:hypothetical protein NHQ30_010316 [Ciborinia camelliae]|nr:hypothetical protein NHQ30_010316 [Ciborinia camelliae]